MSLQDIYIQDIYTRDPAQQYFTGTNEPPAHSTSSTTTDFINVTFVETQSICDSSDNLCVFECIIVCVHMYTACNMGISLNRYCEHIPSKLYLDLCLSRMNDPNQLPQLCQNFTCLCDASLRFFISCILDLGTKPTMLRLRKDHILTENTCFDQTRKHDQRSHSLIKNTCLKTPDKYYEDVNMVSYVWHVWI